MRFTTYLYTAAMALFSTRTLAAAAGDGSSTDLANPISQPLANTVVTAGTPFTIQWLPTAGKIVTLMLRKGKDPKSLDTLEVIASLSPPHSIPFPPSQCSRSPSGWMGGWLTQTVCV